MEMGDENGICQKSFSQPLGEMKKNARNFAFQGSRPSNIFAYLDLLKLMYYVVPFYSKKETIKYLLKMDAIGDVAVIDSNPNCKSQ